MKHVVVTTMHRAGLEAYGRKFLTSFFANWPEDVHLICFAEGWTPADLPKDLPEPERLKLYDLEVECPDLTAFKLRHATDPRVRGIVQDGRSYNYRYDSLRFAHKVFAVARAAEIVGDTVDRMIWLDADVFTHTPVPIEFLDELIPGERDLGYLRREGQFGYPECGFVIYNMKQQGSPMLIRMMRELWRTDQVFGLPEWHDSFVFFVLVTGMEQERMIRTRSLSGGFEGHEHPFINGPLGAYMDHFKGPVRKKIGHSLKDDIAGERNETYWTGLPTAAPEGIMTAAEQPQVIVDKVEPEPLPIPPGSEDGKPNRRQRRAAKASKRSASQPAQG